MRIKQSKLGAPEYEYTRMNNGEQVILRLYNRPQKCVSVIKSNSRQCYPLTDEQYNQYCLDAQTYINPSIKHLTMCHAIWSYKAGIEHDERLKKFYENVAECYKRRIENGQ